MKNSIKLTIIFLFAFLNFGQEIIFLKKNYFDLGVIGTGYPPKYIHLANYLKNYKILTVAILDHWLNFLGRFKKNKSWRYSRGNWICWENKTWRIKFISI